MPGWKLFKLRFVEDLKEQRKVLSTVIDWTTWLYIFIPFTAIFVIFYIDIWNNTASYWISGLSGNAMIMFLLFLSLGASFRSFMYEADQLFILDHTKLYRAFRKVTFFYAFLRTISFVFVVIFLSLPWLWHIVGLTTIQLGMLAIFMIGFRMIVFSIKKVPTRKLFLFLKQLFLYLLFTLFISHLEMETLFLFGVGLIVGAFHWNSRYFIPTKQYFFEEVNEEYKARMRYIKFILGMATNIEKPPVQRRKRPFFLRNGKRIFKEITPENGLLELLLKGFIRHTVYFGSYLRIVGVTISAIIVFPVVVKWIVLLLFILFWKYNRWSIGLYERLLDQQFFVLIPITQEIREHVALRFRRWLMIPAISITGVLTIVLTILS